MSNIEKDNMNMIPDWVIDSIMEQETSADHTESDKKKFQDVEPLAAEWLKSFIREDVELLAATYEDIFLHVPQLPKNVYFLLWRCFLRGWSMGNAKWKGDFILPGEEGDRDPDLYRPTSEDFE